jgi:peptidoglycan/LPS O-acetylase OafA/YrhL
MRFTRIDQLRGFAALAVVVCHFAVSAYNAAPNAGEPPLPWLRLVLGFGYLGVPLFFVISGFCIHLPQARALASRGAVEPDWRRFFRRRFWRLYPPYLCAIALAVVLLLLSTGALPVPCWAIALQALLVHTFHPATFDGVNPPAWTLAVEAQLYLAYPIVLALVVRFRPWPALAIVLGITMLYRVWLNVSPMPPPFGGVAWEFFLARWFEWVLGALVAEWAVGRVVIPRWVRSVWTLVVASAIGLWLEWHTWHYGLYTVKEPVDGVAFALLLLVALGGESERSAAADAPREPRPLDALVAPVGAWLAGVGLYSYSLYLVHRPVQMAFEPLAREIATWPVVTANGIPSSLLLMAATTPLVMWVARLFFRWVEAPSIAIALPAVPRSQPDAAPAASSLPARGRRSA